MVEKIEAKGRLYTEVLEELGRNESNFSTPIFYLDGDESRGELHLGHLKTALERLSEFPDSDSRSIWIWDTIDPNGRDLCVLSVPSDGIVDLQLPSFQPKEPVKKTLPVGEHSLVEGTTFGVLARAVSNKQGARLVMVISERGSEKEAGRIAAEKFSAFSNYPLDQIETFPRLVATDDFWREVKKQIDTGIMVPLYILRRCNLIGYEAEARKRLLKRKPGR